MSNKVIAKEIYESNKYKLEKTTDGYLVKFTHNWKTYEEFIPQGLVTDFGIINQARPEMGQDFAIHLLNKAINKIGERIDQEEKQRYLSEMERIFKERGDSTEDLTEDEDEE